jgi:hypothetical protein
MQPRNSWQHPTRWSRVTPNAVTDSFINGNRARCNLIENVSTKIDWCTTSSSIRFNNRPLVPVVITSGTRYEGRTDRIDLLTVTNTKITNSRAKAFVAESINVFTSTFPIRFWSISMKIADFYIANSFFISHLFKKWNSAVTWTDLDDNLSTLSNESNHTSFKSVRCGFSLIRNFKRPETNLGFFSPENFEKTHTQ